MVRVTPPHQFVENVDRCRLSKTNKVNYLGTAVFLYPLTLSSGLGTCGHYHGATGHQMFEQGIWALRRIV